ncbi:MAG: O-antigen ligase family protein [Actinomycetia bacterium]|nr:O-antigen ligase family protein [Actinomycetes bacterium]
MSRPTAQTKTSSRVNPGAPGQLAAHELPAQTTPVKSRSGPLETLCRILALLFVFTVPFENVLILPVVGTATRAVGAALACTWVLQVTRTGRLRRIDRGHVWAYSFISWSALTMLWSLNPDTSVIRAVTLIQLFIVLLVLWNTFETQRDMRAVLRAFLLGAMVVAVLTLFNGLMGNVSLNARRASIAGTGENYVGRVLSWGLPLAWHLFTNRQSGESRFWGLLYGLYIPAALVAIVFTGSRGSLLATIPFFVYVAWLATRSGGRQLLRTAIAAIVAAGTLVAFAPTEGIERFATISEEVDEGGYGDRTVFWERGMEAISASPARLMVGYGVGDFQSIGENDAHQTFLEVTVELGVIGLGLFISVLACSLRLVLRMPWRERGMWLALASSWFIGAMAASQEYHKVTWLVVAFIIGASAAKSEQLGDNTQGGIR